MSNKQLFVPSFHFGEFVWLCNQCSRNSFMPQDFLRGMLLLLHRHQSSFANSSVGSTKIDCQWLLIFSGLTYPDVVWTDTADKAIILAPHPCSYNTGGSRRAWDPLESQVCSWWRNCYMSIDLAASTFMQPVFGAVQCIYTTQLYNTCNTMEGKIVPILASED